MIVAITELPVLEPIGPVLLLGINDEGIFGSLRRTAIREDPNDRGTGGGEAALEGLRAGEVCEVEPEQLPHRHRPCVLLADKHIHEAEQRSIRHPGQPEKTAPVRSETVHRLSNARGSFSPVEIRV